MTGTIVQINTSPGGVPKRAVFEGSVRFRGLDGDSWAHPQFHGGPNQALLLIAEEVIDILKAKGYPVYPGALGENLTTRGLDPRHFRIGQTYRAGTARFRLTKLRTPCSTIQIYGRQIGREIYDAQAKAGDPASPVWCFAGIYAGVVTEGVIHPGDPISLESELA